MYPIAQKMSRSLSGGVLTQGSVQGLFYVASVHQLVCFGSDAALTTLVEDSEGSEGEEHWQVLTTMRFSLHNRGNKKQEHVEGSGSASSSAATENLLFCWAGKL